MRDPSFWLGKIYFLLSDVTAYVPAAVTTTVKDPSYWLERIHALLIGVSSDAPAAAVTTKKDPAYWLEKLYSSLRDVYSYVPAAAGFTPIKDPSYWLERIYLLLSNVTSYVPPATGAAIIKDQSYWLEKIYPLLSDATLLVPDAPTNLTAVAVSGSQVDLAWTAVGSATGYKIERSTNGVDFAEIADQAGVTYSNTGLSGILTFTYRVIAYNSVGDSAPSGTAAVAYYQRVLATQAANLITYLRLNEASGTVADNAQGTAARDGTYSSDVSTWPVSTGIGDGNTMPRFDGANDYVGIGTASFIAAWSGDLYSWVAWLCINNVAVWTDGVERTLVYATPDATGNISRIVKSSVNNQLIFSHRAGAATAQVIYGTSSTAVMMVGMTVDKANNRMRAFVDGVQVGTDQAITNNWVGVIVGTRTLIGARLNTPLNPFLGSAGHVAYWNRELTPAEMAALATNP